MSKRSIEIKVGFFILVPILLLIVLIILKLGYSLSGETMDVFLKIDSIKMIKEGTEVKVKGFSIGRVVTIQPVYKPELHFLALMRIRRGITLYEDCTAVIQNQNVIGDAMIELRNPDRRGGGNLLRDNDVLEGIEYVSIEALLDDVHTLLATVNDTVGVLKGISLDSRGEIRRLMGDLANASQTLNLMLADSQADVVQTMSALRKTAETLNEVSVELKKHPMKFLLKD